MNEWRKKIPQSRDHVQSQALLWVVAPVLLLFCLRGLTLAAAGGRAGGGSLVIALVISTGFALLAWRLGSATPGAAVCGGMICLLLVQNGTGRVMRSGLPPLVALFVLTFVATRAGRARKAKLGLAENRKGRNAAQVLANLGAAGLVAGLGAGWQAGLHAGVAVASHWVYVVMLAALVEATADTVSSEVGQAFGDQPVSLTSFRRVEVGTDGAVTLLGTAAGAAGGTLVALVGLAVSGVDLAGFAVALGSGVAGLFFDSLLGATVERRGWLGNDLVNFTSTLFAAGLALVLVR